MHEQWAIVELEPAAAARAGLPERVAVPREAVDAGEPLVREQVARWSALFALQSPDHALASSLGALAEAEVPRRRAMASASARRFADAADDLGEAIALTPFDAASRLNRATALRLDGRPEEALGELEEAEWAYSGQAPYHAALGQVFEALDERDRAVGAYERALALAPGDGFLLDRLTALGALARLESPEGEEYWLSLPDFERVMRHQIAGLAEDPDGLVALAVRLAHDGHEALARAAVALALHGDPAHGDALALAEALSPQRGPILRDT